MAIDDELKDTIARKGSKSRKVVDALLAGGPHSRAELAKVSKTPPSNVTRVIDNMRQHGITVDETHGEDGRSKVFQVRRRAAPSRDGASRDGASRDGDGSDALICSLWYHANTVEIETDLGTYVVTIDSEEGTVTLKTPKSEITLV